MKRRLLTLSACVLSVISTTKLSAQCTPPLNQTVTATASSVSCNGSTTINVGSTEPGVFYALRNDADNSVIQGMIAGTGFPMSIGTGPLSTPTTFNVLASRTTGALDFDGVDDYVNIPTVDFSAGSTMAIEMWIKPFDITTNTYYELVRQQSVGGIDFLVAFQGNGTILSFGLNTTVGGYTELDVPITASSYVDGNWHHVAAVYDGVKRYIYVDGSLIGADTKSGNVTYTALTLQIGNYALGSEYYKGQMDELSFWNIAKSNTEVATDMYTCLSGVESGLLRAYHFDDGYGSAILSDVVAGNNGVLLNMDPTSDWVKGTSVCSTCNLEMASTPTVTILTTPTNVAGTYVSPTVNHTDGTTQSYDDGCNALGRIQDGVGGNVLGNTIMIQTVNSSVYSVNPEGYIYGRRKYKVSPTSDGPCKLVMYFTQEDFNDYNANAPSFLSLPTSPADPNIDNIRLATELGGVHTISAPLGAALTWSGSYWIFSVSVNNLSGAQFYVMTMPNCNGITVSNLSTSNILPDAVTANWTSVITTPAWGWYGLQYREVGAPSWVDAGTANNPATSRVVSSLTPNTNYELQIRRHCSSQSTGPWSSSVLFTTLNAGCDSPMTFNTPTATSTSVTLTWTAIAGAAWYEFQYRVVGAPAWSSAGTLGGAATSKTKTGLTAGTNYEFRGRTFCPNGTPSPWSTIATVSTPAASGCALPPGIFTTNITSSSANMNWTPIVDAAWFEFRYRETGAPLWTSLGTLGGAATVKVLSGLTDATQYDFQARTFCANGLPSAWSLTTQFTTGSVPCELPPAISVQSFTNTSVTVQWPTVSGAGWFEFRYKESASGTWLSAGTLGGASTIKVKTGLTPATQYDFQAKTYCNSSVSSAWSSTLQFTTAAAIVVQEDGTVLFVDEKGETIGTGDESTLAGIQEEVLTSLDVVVYPNPTDNIITIQLSTDEAELVVYNAIGKVTYQGDVRSGDQISLRDVESGVYFFEFKTQETAIVKRVVKK